MKGKTQLHPASRSDGDGMEDTSVTKSAPRQLTSPSSSPADLPHPVKRREPKFVPYEPYKAAVTPIMPPATTRRSHRTKLAALEIPFPLMREEDRGRRNIERPSPVISVVREVPEGTAATGCIVESNGDATPHRVASLEQQLETLREQKHDVENQLRVQIQVNGELKKLLVASLGEDMQARVQFLSEDKAKLADDISFYSAKLQEGMEEVDRLSIQSDVWRSKFLASSLMIDELAGWKARLMHQCEDFQESLQWIASEHQHLETNITATFRLLTKLRDMLSPDLSEKQSTLAEAPKDLLQLSASTQQLARAVCQAAHGGANLRLLPAPNVVQTPAERFAQRTETAFETMKRSFTPATAAEAVLSSSLVSKKCQVNGKPTHDCATISCCRHCSGHLETV